MSGVECPDCHGKRLKPVVLAVTIGGKNISDFCEMSIRDELKFIADNEPNLTEKHLSGLFLRLCLCDRSVRALMRGDENIHVFKRTIDDQIVKRALTIMLISFAIALTGLFILSISEQADFIDLLFEVFSAFATVGLTAGITPTLTFVGKIVIIILMYIGRIGPITMVLIFVRKYNAKKGKDVNYIKEHILIG